MNGTGPTALTSHDRPAKWLDIPGAGGPYRFVRVAGADKAGREPLGTYSGTVGRWSVTLRHMAVCVWTWEATDGEVELTCTGPQVTPIRALAVLLRDAQMRALQARRGVSGR